MARCKSCGVELRTGARFCDMCGAKVEKSVPTVEKCCGHKPSFAIYVERSSLLHS